MTAFVLVVFLLVLMKSWHTLNIEASITLCVARGRVCFFVCHLECVLMFRVAVVFVCSRMDGCYVF